MSRQAIRSEVIFSGFSSRVDGSLGFRGNTPELKTEEKVAMMNLQGILCEMLILPKDEKEAEVVEVRREMEHKSPSQRLRAVLFLLWKSEKTDSSFEEYYQKKMEQIIDWLKRKLPDEGHGYR